MCIIQCMHMTKVRVNLTVRVRVRVSVRKLWPITLLLAVCQAYARITYV